MPRHEPSPPSNEKLTPPDWFRQLYRALKARDRDALMEAWDNLYAAGWEISHRSSPSLRALARERCYRPDERPPVRIWGFAPLAGLTIRDLCQRINDGEVPVPQDYDAQGPLWDRGVVDRWIKRKGLDK